TVRAELNPGILAEGLNAALPDSVKVLAARAMPRTFHAHWSSTGKTYRYRVAFSDVPRAWRLPSERFPFSSLDSERLRRGLALLLATKDLSTLCGPSDRPKPRSLERASVLEETDSLLTLELSSSGFGRH